MKTNICPICVVVSSVWLILSWGVVWGYLNGSAFLIPIALLMGGSVVGINHLGEKRCQWAASHSLQWRSLVILVGMPTAYLFITNLNEFVVIVEAVALIIIAYFFFIKQPSAGGFAKKRISEIEEQMKHCC